MEAVKALAGFDNRRVSSCSHGGSARRVTRLEPRVFSSYVRLTDSEVTDWLTVVSELELSRNLKP